MTMMVKCPKCENRYGLREKLIEKKLQCKCGGIFVFKDPRRSKPDSRHGDDQRNATPPFWDDVLAEAGSNSATSEAHAGSTAVRRTIQRRRDSQIIVLAFSVVGVGAVLLISAVCIETFLRSRPSIASTTAVDNKSARGYDTPEEAFKAVNEAAIAKDYATHVAAHTPEARRQIVGAVAMSAIMFSDVTNTDGEIRRILRKYGVNRSELKMPPPPTSSQDFRKLTEELSRR